MPALTAGNVEDARSDWQSKNVNDARHLVTIALQCEERAVLQEIVGVEAGLPPLTLPGQKNTGSR